MTTLNPIRAARHDGHAAARNVAQDYTTGRMTHDQLMRTIRDYEGCKQHYARCSPAWHYASAFLRHVHDVLDTDQ